MATILNIKPDILNWAISRSGYEHGEFIEKFPRAKSWLDQEKTPTIPQLRDFAKKANVPFGYLFLQTPPVEEIPIPFFRTLNGETEDIGINLRDTILTLQKRQDWIRNYLIEQGEESLPYVGKYTIQTPQDEVIADIKKTLGLGDNWARALPNWEKALNHLAEKVEEAGIFIVFNSVVGLNNRRKIKVDDCRGFVLSDEYAPFMFVNSADSKSAQMFTIAHELAHIWIGKSAGFDFRNLQPSDDETELYCDKIAAEFLVPQSALEEAWHEGVEFEQLARLFKVSQIVIARRALDLGKITRQEFFEFYNERKDYYRQKKEERKNGGDFYASLRKKLNLRFFNTVDLAAREGTLLYKHAYELTGLKGNTYQKVVKEFGG